MSDEDETTLDVRGLDALIKVTGAKSPSVRVGILGGKAARNQDNSSGVNNAEVGSFHEFGTSELPQRSFLRVPIADHLEKEMERAGAFDEDVLSAAMKEKSLVPYMKKIAALAEEIVLQAFASGGFGKWRPSNMEHKKNAQTLVETHQLRDSITSEVKE